MKTWGWPPTLGVRTSNDRPLSTGKLRGAVPVGLHPRHAILRGESEAQSEQGSVYRQTADRQPAPGGQAKTGDRAIGALEQRVLASSPAAWADRAGLQRTRGPLAVR